MKRFVNKFDETIATANIVLTIACLILCVVNFVLGDIWSGIFMLFMGLIGSYTAYRDFERGEK
jgi:hypothetical protein